MTSSRPEEFLQLGQSSSPTEFEARLVSSANRMGFGLVSAVLMKGEYEQTDVVVRAVSNTPKAYAEISRSLDMARADPVMQRLMSEPLPLFYDQRLYVDAGAGDMWETQSPFGYSTGIAVALRLPRRRHFLIGVDRPQKLPRSEDRLNRMMQDLQLIAVHAQYAASRLFDAELDAPGLAVPKLTKRELECLKWTMAGKSSGAIADILHISMSAVNFHLLNANSKLDVSSKYQAVLRAVGMGLL